jgi:hypothetical protein
MRVRNLTNCKVEALFEAAAADCNHDSLTVEVKYCPTGSKRSASGTYYRWAPSAPNGRLIRLRINRTNRYPITVSFKTSDYFKRIDSRGREITYQRLRHEKFACAEHLLVAVFLHEFSHFLDHVGGRNGRYKQTKADRFAVERLTSLGIIQ